jgi:disulfide oxidoreductase YuzD
VATVSYHDVTEESVATDNADIISAIKDNSLVYPVTVIDGKPVYDGAVSYPAILRVVAQRLDAAKAANA